MSATMNEFEQLLMEEEKSLKSIKTGDTVEGVVFDVKPDEIILNIGSKSDGILTRNEYTNEPGVDLTTVVKQIKELHEEDEESDVSIGIDRVLGLYKLSNSRRWYDKVSILSYAMKTMSTLPKEDFYHIMEGIAISAGAESVA